MDSVAPVSLRRRYDRRDVEIGARTPAGNQHRLVAPADVQAACIVLRIDGATRNAEFGRGARDTDCDLAAIGDEELLQFRSSV
jgi:hypothetical protein